MIRQVEINFQSNCKLQGLFTPSERVATSFNAWKENIDFNCTTHTKQCRYGCCLQTGSIPIFQAAMLLLGMNRVLEMIIDRIRRMGESNVFSLSTEGMGGTCPKVPLPSQVRMGEGVRQGTYPPPPAMVPTPSRSGLGGIPKYLPPPPGQG